MTIPVSDRIAGPFNANGAVVAFDFAFKVFTTTDIRVVLTDVVGIETVLLLTTNYTVVLNADQENDPGGTVTTVATYATGNKITIDGALPYAQPTEITNLGGFFPKVIEKALDRLAILVQQLKKLVDRAVLFPVSDAIGSFVLPTAANRAGKTFMFDNVGNPIASTGVGALSDLMSVFEHMTIAQRADVMAGTALLDVSTAVQAAVDTGKSLFFPHGVYRTVTKLVWGESNVRYIFAGAVLLFDGAPTTRLLDITGSNVTAEGFVFSGNNKQVSYALVCVETDAAFPRLVGTFKDVYGTHIGGSSNATNNQYGLVVSPYGVVGFHIDIVCDNIKNRNTSAGGWTPIEGGGFCGAVMFMKSDWTEPDAVQTAPTSGYLNVIGHNAGITELDAALSLADQISFNDGDGVRTYGNETGLTKLHIKIDGYFFNCSKRGVKVSVSAGVKMGEITVVATTALQYPMVTAVKVDGNECSIEDLKVYAPSTAPIYNVLQSHRVNNLSLGRIWCNYATNAWDIAPLDAADILLNYRLESLIVESCAGGGIVNSVTPAAIRGWVFDHVSLKAASGVLDFTAVQLGTVSSELDITFNDLRVVNGDVKLAGFGWTLSGYQEISVAGFTGTSAATQLMELGTPPNIAVTRRTLLKDYTLNVVALDDGWFSGSRIPMFSIYGQRITVENLDVTVPEALTASFPHGSFFGHDINVDGFNYSGQAAIYWMETAKATYGPYKRCTSKNASRNGAVAATQPFFYLGDGQRCVFSDTYDLRNNAAGSIEVAGGTAAAGDTDAWIIDGVFSATSSAGAPTYGAALALALVTNEVKF